MGFAAVDDFLTRQMTGEARTPVAEYLGIRLVQFARGVAVHEMSLRAELCNRLGTVENGVLTTLAETAISAAALTTLADEDHTAMASTRELRAHFDGPVASDGGETLRAEAIVVRADGESIRIEAEVFCDATRVARFEATRVRETAIR